MGAVSGDIATGFLGFDMILWWLIAVSSLEVWALRNSSWPLDCYAYRTIYGRKKRFSQHYG
jgi:hypothetical protein